MVAIEAKLFIEGNYMKSITSINFEDIDHIVPGDYGTLDVYYISCDKVSQGQLWNLAQGATEIRFIYDHDHDIPDFGSQEVRLTKDSDKSFFKNLSLCGNEEEINRVVANDNGTLTVYTLEYADYPNEFELVHRTYDDITYVNYK